MCASDKEARPFRMMRRAIVHPRTREKLDDALVTFFPHGRSFTGQATLELHLHGSAAVVRDVLEALSDMQRVLDTRDIRPALPGEFTRRAFEHGRMDLTACEALDSLLHAETTQQRRFAQRAASGYQARMYDQLHMQLLDACAHTEAMLDFDDEDQIDTQLWHHVRDTVQRMRTYLASELQLDTPTHQRTYADAVMHGLRIALYGRPNAGKSSLLNRLVRRDAAIVTPYAGTTRDIIEVSMELAGYRVSLADTAGLRNAHDVIEKMGMERTQTYVQEADLRVLVCTPDDLGGCVPAAGHRRLPKDMLERWGAHMDEPVLVLVNKMDTYTPSPTDMDAEDGVPCVIWHTSVRHNVGIDTLLHDLASQVSRIYEKDEGSVPLVTQARHRHLLLEVVASLDAMLRYDELDDAPDLVMIAEELRRAASALAQVTGRAITSDTVLGEIFARFCIGK